mgnify:CR=1 FL=1
MRKSKSYNYKLLMGMILGILLSVVGVKAASYLGSGSELVYDNSSSGLSSVNVQNALDEVYSKFCPDNYVCLKKKSTLALGDYVQMTPTKSSYTTDKSKTGFTSTQTINPQELNLWRVIKINGDGTVEMISEHVSSTAVSFQGKTGYQNLVGYLNVLASQYENSAYTKGSRHFGYNGQTEYITDTSKFVNPAPWTCNTGESCNPVESQGGGDTLYTTDYNLVNTALGTRAATQPGNAADSAYWMASRYYEYSSSTSYRWGGRYVSFSVASSSRLYRYNSSSFYADNIGVPLRPIVVLKSGLKYSGVGTERLPMEISVS